MNRTSLLNFQCSLSNCMFRRSFIAPKDKINEINDNTVNQIEVGVISRKWENTVVISGTVARHAWVLAPTA